jgi:hypothetical protein
MAIVPEIGPFTGTFVFLSGKITKKEGAKSIASGLASATIVKQRSEKTQNGGQGNESSDEMLIRASEIVFDAKTNSLACVGMVEITASGRTIKGKDVTVEFGDLQAGCVLIDQAKAIDLPNKPPPATEPTPPRP